MYQSRVLVPPPPQRVSRSYSYEQPTQTLRKPPSRIPEFSSFQQYTKLIKAFRDDFLMIIGHL